MGSIKQKTAARAENRFTPARADGFTQNFDALIDIPLSVQESKMGQISLVPDHGSRKGGFDLDNTYEHTPGHADCPACQAANRALVADNMELASMAFSTAAKSWTLLRRQDQDTHDRTHETTQGYLDALERFFGALRLCDITPGQVRGYQIARLHNLVRIKGDDVHPWKRVAGHSTVNHELSVLGQMLTHCRLWHRIKPYYFPLSIPSWSPREILTEEDEEQLWLVASRHPEAALAYWVATITNNTTAAGGELRGLRIKNIFLKADDISEIYIPADAVKNNSRPRKIALNPTAKWAIEQCYKRALKLGSCQPNDYLFPFRIKINSWDPSRPASRFFLRNSWNKLRKATGFADLNPHDLRHHCITRLLENDVNENTVQAIAGHVSAKMMEYYSHHRRRVKYDAVLAIETKKNPAPDAASAQQRRQG
jgi:integrase